jgi:PKD repeat protein
MKKLITFLSILALCAPTGAKATGGPDAFGYTWITSLDAGGPAYNWIDITGRSGVQTVTGLADDNSAASMINLGFPFHYYWSDYSQLKAGSNGWIAFNNISNIASCFPTIPTAGGAADNYLAPLMSDLNFTGAGNPGQVKYWTNSVDSFIISYINVPFWTVSAPGWAGPNSFQVILCSSDSSITFQYASLSALPANAACVDLTVGIENSTGAIGLQVHSDAMPPSNYVIRFEAPAVPLLSIQDLYPRWNNNSENQGTIILQNLPILLNSDIRNGGNADISVTSNLQATVTDQSAATVFSASGTLPSLNAGVDTIFNYSPSWTPAASGLYTFNTTTTCSQDINNSNNSNSTEILVVNGCNPSMTLSYEPGTTPSGSLNWNGGANDDGAAVYYAPPIYPYTVTSLQYFITSNVNNYFIAQVYDDDGPNGTAGTLLFTTTVAAGSVITNAWNTVAVNPGVTLTNGGFYVVWLQGGTNIFLGQQSSGALSHHNYEILDGAWATYRYGNANDLCIRATVNGYSTVPVAGFSSAFASSLTVDFTDTSSGLGLTYAWDFGDGNTSTAANPSHTYAAEGVYNVCLITTSYCGTSDTICQSVTACAVPVVNTDPVAALLCEGTDTSFTVAASGTGITYQWQEDQGAGFTDLSASATYVGVNTATLTIDAAMAAMNNYQYRCIVTGTCGGDTSAAALLSVNPAPVAGLSALPHLCADYAAITLNEGSPAGGTYSGTGVSSGMFDPGVSGSGSFVITYVYTDAFNCSDSATNTITVDTVPVVTLDPFATVCVNSAAFTLSGGAPAGGIYLIGTPVTTFDPSAYGAGTFSVTYIFTDGNACTDSTSQNITVDPCVGIKEQAASLQLQIWPNPANERIQIASLSDIQLHIYDAFGRTVKTVPLSRGTNTIDIRELSAGMYTFRIDAPEGNVMKKVIIEK